jgi:hypothetical protein
VTDPQLIESWLGARSVIRGLPAPVAESGGLRVDVNGPLETRRYVFARLDPGLKRLAETIEEPRVFLKVCGTPDEVAPYLTERWAWQPGRWVMTLDGPGGGAPPAAPDGYRLELSEDGGVARARIVAADGEVAASGRATENARVFMYDMIETAPDHQRRGLGKVVMRALGTTKRDPAKPHMLVATPDGKGLYEALGWRVYAPFTTAGIGEIGA